MTEDLLTGARTGAIIEFGDDGSGRTDVDALDVDAVWGPDRQIAAGDLLDVLTGRTSVPAHVRGVRLRGARITGAMAWDWQQLAVPLELLDCVVDEPIDLDHAQIAGLSLIRCRLPGLSAEQMTCASTLKLIGSVISGTVMLRDAEISGAVLAAGAVLRGEVDRVDWPGSGPVALLATRLHVTGALLLGDGFTAEGMVLLPGARVGGNLTCSGGRFQHPDGDALQAVGVEVVGNVVLADGFVGQGRVNFDRARIGGDFSCDGGTFTAPGTEAIALNRIDIGGRLVMRDGFVATGSVHLIGARIGSNWNCDNGTFVHHGPGEAIWASDARIGGAVYFRGSFSSTGSVRMLGVEVGGNFRCGGATFSNPGGYALRAGNLTVQRDLQFGGPTESEWCSAEGEVALDGITVGGRATFSGSTFTNPAAVALNLADATFEGNLFMGNGFQASGQVLLGNSRIGGSLNCGGGTFSIPPTDTRPEPSALHMVNLEVGDNVLLHNGFRAVGQVRMNRTRIGGVLECSGGRFVNPGRHALFARAITVGAGVLFGTGFVAEGSVRISAARITGDLNCTGGRFEAGFEASGAQVSGSFRWRQLTHEADGWVDLIRAQVGELDDDLGSWPAAGRLVITGFGYDRLSDRAPRGPGERVDWIRRQPGYTPEPYQQLAAVYRSNGQVREATDVAIAQQDDLLARGDLSRPARAWAWFLGRSIGHGYRPGRAAWALLVLYAVTVGTVWLGVRADAFIQTGNTAPQPGVTASRCDDAYPCLSVPAYALENITPILNLRQGENWAPKGSTPAQRLLRDWLYLTTIVGYAGTTLLAAALSGLARSA